ncbi:antibiotic biosynthesis monooxygenase family protein [Parafrankia sp. FMc6]|uniref:antibiotic biosynthesis monooxygenase family protein n=1 Tax=Parafrankia soli TaxID=2599596 RepID=UPI0034D496FA
MSVSGVPPRDSGVVEVARFDVLPGSEEEFAAAYRTVRHELVATPGCRSARMTRGVESPSSFVLLVDWDSLEAHTETFRGSDRFTRWRAALSPFFAAAPSVEHVVAITDPVAPAPAPAPASADRPASS